ncbi:YceI family protein [Paraherbaspirillum soli]|uniref:YceI family protein n=1 Tax=Paraherbaspirillum soli TaxID=631222 RepID=A0ABW0M8Z4_9BURK
MPTQMRRTCLIAVMGCLLAACVPRLPSPAPVQIPAGFPESAYRQAEARGIKVLRVDPDRSLVTIEVRRAGALARLGHDHVVASHNVRGYVSLEEGRADLYLPLDRLVVDEPALRAEAGFDTHPSAEAIEGTRSNMLEKVLESERFPYVLIHAARSAGDPSKLSVAITLHGTTRTFEIPAQIETVAGGIAASGRMTFNQSDFGIAPYSILNGALQVQDRLDLHFRILAGDK